MKTKISLRPRGISRNRLALTLIVAIIIAAALSAVLYAGILYGTSVQTSDLLYQTSAPHPDIVILKIDDKSIQALGRWPWDRHLYAEFIDKLNMVGAKTIAIDVSFTEPSGDDPILQNILNRFDNVILVGEYTEFDQNGNPVSFLAPVFDNATIAYANIGADVDGVTRTFPPRIEGSDGIPTLKSLARTVAELYAGKELPIPNEQHLIVDFAHAGSFAQFSISDFLQAGLDYDFAGKLVFIGATAENLHDFRTTPVDAHMPGVEVHAHIAQMLLNGSFLNYQDNASTALVVLLLSIVSALILSKLKLIFSTPLVILIAIVFFFAALQAFISGTIMNVFFPLLALALTYVSSLGIFYFTEARQRKLVTGIFGKYVSKEVADHILKSGEDVSLHGEKRDATMLFGDIRGFTSTSEKLSPEQVVGMLNYYFDAMTKIVFKYKGTLDKFVGDEIMAEWNVPLEQKDHALLAIKAALEMQQTVEKLANDKNNKYPAVKYGIGINTGPVVAGNMGSTERFDYTVIGDAVNLAARLCGQAEGGTVVISQYTYEIVKDKVKVKPLGDVKVKGKEKPITIYQALEVIEK